MDDAARRREARRRKILENSQNRLNRITGVEEKSSPEPPLQNHTQSTECAPHSNHVSNERVTQVQKVETKPQKQYRRTVISALAVFVNLLLLFIEKLNLDSSSSHINKIFLPLFLYEVIEALSPNREKAERKSLLYLFLLANARGSYMLALMKYLELASYILQDVMVYFFVFVCCDSVKHLLWVIS